jgi:hypothetical protein
MNDGGLWYVRGSDSSEISKQRFCTRADLHESSKVFGNNQNISVLEFKMCYKECEFEDQEQLNWLL